jgi:1-acyl-sn-glycerol-3-phosphate acyltransferase
VLIALMRGFYFRRIRAPAPIPATGARLFLISHRNGAIDGYMALAAAPDMQFMLSAQLLRHPFLRLMFTGIPVVRARDVQRHGMKRSAFADPVETACAVLRAGGALGIFPEGYSEWGPHPLPYQAGGARIVRRLLEEGAALQVIPLGLFYRAPDRFRSDVEVLAGPPVVLPAKAVDEHRRHWEKRIDAALGAALDAVSVNCPDQETFEQVERLAAAEVDAVGSDASYALAFRRWQAAENRPLPSSIPPALPGKPAPWAYPFIAVFYLFCAPILGAGAFMGKKADAKNTISFFRFIGGLAAALLWLPALLALFCFFPWQTLILAALAYVGWKQC